MRSRSTRRRWPRRWKGRGRARRRGLRSASRRVESRASRGVNRRASRRLVRAPRPCVLGKQRVMRLSTSRVFWRFFMNGGSRNALRLPIV
jgi:hypothetical protein